jgi:hypothetical protein
VVLRSEDLAVTGSAIEEGAEIYTRDVLPLKFLNAAGIPARSLTKWVHSIQ